MAKRKTNPVGRTAKTCQRCGSEFNAVNRVAKFCSNGCRMDAWRNRQPVTETTCVHCRNRFTPQRSDGVYCSARCRVAAKRKRDGVSAPKPAGKTTRHGGYLYCHTRCSPDQPPQVRRYVIASELKTKLKLQPGFDVRTDGKWVHHDAEPIDVMKLSNGWLNHSLGNFSRSLPRDWSEGLPEPEPKPTEESETEPVGDIFSLLNRNKPNWSLFGFQGKPPKAEFQKAYRRLAIKLHPDAGGDKRQFADMQASSEKCLATYR